MHLWLPVYTKCKNAKVIIVFCAVTKGLVGQIEGLVGKFPSTLYVKNVLQQNGVFSRCSVPVLAGYCCVLPRLEVMMILLT